MKGNKNMAQEYFNKIGTGKKNAVKRPGNAYTDRALRKMIEEAQRDGDIIINGSDGEGYFRPDLKDPEEVQEYRHYVNGKKSRMKALARTIYGMEQAYEEIIDGEE